MEDTKVTNEEFKLLQEDELYDIEGRIFGVDDGIYIIALLMGVALIWMCVFKIDIVVKAESMFRGNEESTAVSSSVSGEVVKTLVMDGEYVECGDELFEIDSDELSESIAEYRKKLDDTNSRLEILEIYEKSLDEGEQILETQLDNQYYKEFSNRRILLFKTIDSASSTDNSSNEIYQESIDASNSSIQKYNEKLQKLENVKNCIKNRSNTIDPNDSYYYAIVSSYISVGDDPHFYKWGQQISLSGGSIPD